MDYVLKKYQRKFDYSYTLGAFPTIELLKNKPDKVIEVIYHPDLNSEEQYDILTSLCSQNKITLRESKKDVEKLRDKDNCLCIGVFSKYTMEIDSLAKGHVMFVNPSDMGNMGTNIRTCMGFSVNDIAIIEPAVDIFNPKVIRASMGAIFRMNIKLYTEFDQYRSIISNRRIYSFMLEGATDLQKLCRDKEEKYTLVFGNEASGLPSEYADYGQSIFIRHSDKIDSLNLSMATGIALYEFNR